MSDPGVDRCSLRGIDEVHRELGELFLQHQERLLVFDFEWAERILLQYGTALRLHIRHEDELLLPIYDQPDVPRRARADVFAREHKWIVRRLGDLETRLRDLRSKELKPRQVLALIEREMKFKHYLHHHEERERQYLFPILDGRLPKSARGELLSRCEREWQEAGMPRGRYLPGPAARSAGRARPAPGRATPPSDDDPR